MTAQELNTYIDKVLGNSLRCLLPSYWWKRLLKLVVEYVESVKDSSEKQIGKVSDSVGVLDGLVKKSALFRIKVTASEDDTAIIQADGKEITIPSGKTRNIPFTYEFRFGDFPYGGVGCLSVEPFLANTSMITNMASMFYNGIQLEKLDVSNFDTSNVTDMGRMFYYCQNLQELDVSGFDTTNVKSMDSMFYACSGLKELDVSNFDTTNVKSMDSMFYACSGLKELDVSNFDTSNVIYMGNMFYNTGFDSLDLSNFDTSNVTDMKYMFRNCNRTTTLTLGVNFFKTRNVTSVSFASVRIWSEESAIQSLVTNSYDRASNGLATLELLVYNDVYAYITDEHKATLTAKGYTIAGVDSDEDFDD